MLEERSNQMFTDFHLSSLFKAYKTMWFCFCFMSQAGGGLCVSWTLCCLIWPVIKSWVNYVENLCWLIPLMAWVVQADQAGEKTYGLPVRWEPSKPIEVGTGTSWFFAGSTWKADPSGVHFQQLVSKPQWELCEKLNFYSRNFWANGDM